MVSTQAGVLASRMTRPSSSSSRLQLRDSAGLHPLPWAADECHRLRRFRPLHPGSGHLSCKALTVATMYHSRVCTSRTFRWVSDFDFVDHFVLQPIWCMLILVSFSRLDAKRATFWGRFPITAARSSSLPFPPCGKGRKTRRGNRRVAPPSPARGGGRRWGIRTLPQVARTCGRVKW